MTQDDPSRSDRGAVNQVLYIRHAGELLSPALVEERVVRNGPDSSGPWLFIKQAEPPVRYQLPLVAGFGGVGFPGTDPGGAAGGGGPFGGVGP